MKLQQLAVGARFEFEGVVFVKTGPLTAASEAGGQRMIPRYAMVRPLDVPETATGPAGRRKLDEARVLAAFGRFYETCGKLLDATAHAELAAARQQFLAALK